MTAKDLWYKPKLIEVALPLEDISRAATHEKAVRHGHPSTLHLWWSRKPLAAARAVLFAQLVDDPSARPELFPTEAEQKAERERLHEIISRMSSWGNINDSDLFKAANEEILKSTGGNPPSILDPFAGGGSIPLEAERLGLHANASDLNPVSVLVNKALIEIPPKWVGHSPVFPGVASERLSWPRLSGLAEDVRRYGKWVNDQAEDRIGHLYPKITVSGVESTVIAWIWARTVACPNPACADMLPLVNNFWLGKKKGKERYIVPIVDGKRVRFEINGPNGRPREGTVNGRTGAICLICGTPVPINYIRAEGKAHRMGSQLMAIAAEGKRQRYYLAPTDDQESIAENISRPTSGPDAELPENARWFSPPLYGMTTYSDLFTDRQLTALTTFSDLIIEARQLVEEDSGSRDYANSIVTYLAFALSKMADNLSNLCVWRPDAIKESINHVFALQALPMTWGYGEGNPFHAGPCNISTGASWIAKAIEGLPVNGSGNAVQSDATATQGIQLVSTDPPYYDNIGYADLSDFFYVWLRRTLGDLYPELLSTVLTPKNDELVADPFRHQNKDNAQKFFEAGFNRVFRHMRENTPDGYPITVFYAFKQAETKAEGDHASTGWETLLEGVLNAGWSVTATWPIRTELANRAGAIGANSLAASIALACRPRRTDAGFTDRRGLINALREEFPEALRRLEESKVAPVDLRQAAIGPGMAIFSRYSRVNEPDGSPMRVRAALSLINQVLDEKLSQLEGNVSADTRWCVEWYKQYGFEQGPYGTAETLSKGIDTSIAGLERAGVLVSRAGRVKLQSLRDIPDLYDPRDDERTSEWEICLHLAKQLDQAGVDAAASLMAAAREVPQIDLDDVRELAYLLYSIAEKKGWAEIALLFNNLGTSWTDIEDASRRAAPGAGGGSGQGEFMLEFGSGEDGDE